MHFCDLAPQANAAEQDRLLRFADAISRELRASGASVALVARSGLALERFGHRYSHAGVAMAGEPGRPWAVRQLYYACDEARPRLFDQGLPGFVFGTHDAGLGYVSIVLLPPAAARALEAAAADRARALRLVAGTYSANAYPFSLRYQNCNQWLIELIAAAWGSLADGTDLRARAQAWLASAGYEPGLVDLRWFGWRLAAAFVPWLHFDDQPEQEQAALRVRTSLPASIEAFARERWPEAQRIELCHDGQRIVVRRGWTPIAAGCVAAAGDQTHRLDDDT
jgi:hypothetical protein